MLDFQSVISTKNACDTMKYTIIHSIWKTNMIWGGFFLSRYILYNSLRYIWSLAVQFIKQSYWQLSAKHLSASRQPPRPLFKHRRHEISAVCSQAENAVIDGGMALSGQRRVSFSLETGVLFTPHIKQHYLHVIRGAEARHGDNGGSNDGLWDCEGQHRDTTPALWRRLYL